MNERICILKMLKCQKYDISRKGLMKGLDASSINEVGKPINYNGSKRECDTKT